MKTVDIEPLHIRWVLARIDGVESDMICLETKMFIPTYTKAYMTVLIVSRRLEFQ